MKRIIALLLCVLCIAGILAGCNKAEKTETKQPEQSQGPEKIPVSDTQTKYYDIPENDQLKYDIKFDEYITLPNYETLRIDYDIMEKTEPVISKQIYNLLLQKAKKTEVTDRAAQEGDVVLIDYSSVLFGTDTKVAQTSNTEITLGNDDHDIPEFDDAIIGMKKGESKTVELVYPANYKKNSTLSSVKVSATITLNSIMTAELPELNDETIKSFGFGDSVYNEATLREYIKLWIDEQNLQRKMDEIYQQTLKQSIIIAYPKTEYTYYESEFDSNEAAKAKMYQVELESYISSQYGSTEAYNAARTAYAQQYTTEDLILHSLAKKYNVKVTTESYNKALNNFYTQKAAEIGIDNTDDFYNYMGTSVYRTHLLDLVFSAVEKDVH